jgi:outer membrane protein assembly factor BamB
MFCRRPVAVFSSLSLALLALVGHSCQSAAPNREPTGTGLPPLVGQALDGREFDLPADLAGRPAVLLIGYVQEAQFDADRWLFGLLQAGTPARILEIPTIGSRIASAFSGSIDSGMRSGIPSEDWGSVVTLYGADARALKAFTGTERPRNMRVIVLDAEGTVRWFHDRGFSAGKLLELDRLVRSWSEPEPEPEPGGTATSTLPVTPVPASASEWPQWRGPARDGHVDGAEWPEVLSEATLTEVWSVDDLGPSYSGPIVAGDLVFTTETVDGELEVVRALDRATGAERWRAAWGGAMKVPFFASRNGSWIRATPAFDGERLYVAGMRDVLVCLEAATGRELWRLDFPRRTGSDVPAFGFVSSPLIDGENVIVQAGGAVTAVDRRSGEVRWRSLEDGGGNDSAFSSPVRATLHGVPQLLVQTRSDLAGLEPATGAPLWSLPVPAFRGMNILTPQVVGDDVFTSAYGGRAWRIALDPGEGGFTPRPVWNAPQQGYMTSPVVVDGHAYLFLRSNRFACLDLAGGEERWTSPPPGDEYWSLVTDGKRILALSNTGTLRLLRASPDEYQLLGEVEVADEETWAHLAVAGDELHVRSLDGYRVLRWRDERR